MIPAVAGILFTLNPVTGNAAEIVVNCTRGLGDSVASGTVTPFQVIFILRFDVNKAVYF